jgi:hypothetical protein
MPDCEMCKYLLIKYRNVKHERDVLRVRNLYLTQKIESLQEKKPTKEYTEPKVEMPDFLKDLFK